MKTKKGTILVIEDNELNREILKEMLSDQYDVITSIDGLEGIRVLRENISVIDLVLLDVQMPVMDGYEVLVQVKSDPKLQNIPIMVTTSSNRVDEEERCLSLGAVDFLQKPYNPRIVKHRIHNILSLVQSKATLTEVEVDVTTGVYTRSAFKHYATELIAQNPNTDYTLIVTDIVGFKHYVAQYGEVEGGELLARTARILESNKPEGAMIGAYGFDQFVCLFPTGKDSKAKRLKHYGRISTRLGKQINAIIKIGVNEHIDHQLPLNLHIERTVVALDKIKHHYGEPMALVNDALLSQMDRRLAIEMQMQKALKRGEFEVYYQPKHNVRTGKLVGAEALLRWNSKTLGPVSPSEFIPIFEQTGFVAESDAFVWRETCKHIKQWREAGYALVPVSINLSRFDFHADETYERLLSIAREYQVPTYLLHIEVTESFFTDRLDEMKHTLTRFRDAGFKIELDDFGTGYSSLHFLADMPLDTVKFDRGFVLSIEDPRQRRVLDACVNLAKRLKLHTLSEGVETEEQKAYVKEMGVEIIQGFLYSKPLSHSAFEQYFRQMPLSTPEEHNRATMDSDVDIVSHLIGDFSSERYAYLVNGLCHKYRGVYILDVNTGYSDDLSLDSDFRENVTDSAEAFEIQQKYVNETLLPEYRQSYLDFFNPKTMDERLRKNPILTFEFEDSRVGWMRSTIIPAAHDEEGRLTKVIMLAEDFDKQRVERDRLRHLAERDALTGVGNRYCGATAMNEHLQQRTAFSVLLFDIDNIKFVNDSFGHPVGDDVIVAVAHHIQAVFDGDVIVRMGGDEFMVIVDEMLNRDRLDCLMQVLFNRITAIHPEGLGKDHVISVSAGVVAIAGDEGYTYDSIYRIADKRLYESKTHVGCYYSLGEN